MSNVDKNAEIILVNPTASGGTINLPLTTAVPYRTLTIKHIGSTSLNGVTVATQGSDRFEDGTSSYVITRITTFVTFYANTSANRWVLVGGTNTFTQNISSLLVNTINGQAYIPMSPSNLVSTSFLDTTLISTVNGINNTGYLSTLSLSNLVSTPFLNTTLISTVNGINNTGYLSTLSLSNLVSTPFLNTTLISTVNGINNTGYLSTLSLSNLVSTPFLDTTLISTVNGINNTGYLSTLSLSNLVSTPFLDTTLISTVNGINNTGYLSTLSLSNLVSTPFLNTTLISTVNGINNTGYLSTLSLSNLVSTPFLDTTLISTVNGINNTGYLSTAVTQIIAGTNISISPLGGQGVVTINAAAFPTVVTQIVAGTNVTISPTGGQGVVTINASGGGGGGSGDVTSTNLTSTTLGLGTLGYISSFPPFLSTSALFTSSFVASTICTTNTLFTTALVARSTNISSMYVSNLTANNAYISSLQVDELLLGSGDGWTETGPLRATYISSLQENTGALYATNIFVGNTSTLNTIRYWGLTGNYNNTILAEISTGTAFGAQEFLVFKGSSASDRIRFQTTGDIRFEPQVAAREFSNATALASPTMILQSNLVGINTATPVATLDVHGTTITDALFTSSFVASTISTTHTLFANAIRSASTITGALFASSFVASTISVTNILFTTALVARSTNLSSVYISNLTGVQGYISALTTDSLTIGDGNGWVDFGAARAVVFSSIQENTGSLYATTAYIGNTSTLNQVRYWGLFGNYNNTILAEVSTGTAVGAQEFLVFKGSSASDRIRFQTTGDIRFEPQVAAREFSTATALATPTMILQSNLVGINTIAPIATLDVRGTAFASAISTQQFFYSSINGVPASETVSTGILRSTLQSTMIGLSNLAVTSIIAGTNITISPVNGKGDVTINATSGGGGITAGDLASTVRGLGTVNYVSGPNILVSTVFGVDVVGSLTLTASTIFIANDLLASEFPAWNSSNQISGSDPEPTPLAMDVFGSARILKNLYVGSTTTVVTTAGVQTQQISTLTTNTSTLTLRGEGPLYVSTNTTTNMKDLMLTDYFIGTRAPIPNSIIVSSITTDMEMQPEYIGKYFVLTNEDTHNPHQIFFNLVNTIPGWWAVATHVPTVNFYPPTDLTFQSQLGTYSIPATTTGGYLGTVLQSVKWIIQDGLVYPFG